MMTDVLIGGDRFSCGQHTESLKHIMFTVLLFSAVFLLAAIAVDNLLVGSFLPVSLKYIHLFNVTNLLSLTWHRDLISQDALLVSASNAKICFLVILQPSVSYHSNDQFCPRVNMRVTPECLQRATCVRI